MSKADDSWPPGGQGQPRAAAAGEARAGNEFAIHEHIGRHLKAMFEAVANEPIPTKLRELLDELERKQEDEQPASDNPSTC